MHIRAESYVYFMFNPKTSLIKIGFSRCPTSRKDCLNTEHKTKLEILGMVPGTMHDERMMHFKFWEHRSHHEWFFDFPSIREEAANGVSELEYKIADSIYLMEQSYAEDDGEITEEIALFRITAKKRLIETMLTGKRFPSPANLHQISQATEGKVTFEDWAHAYQPKEKAE